MNDLISRQAAIDEFGLSEKTRKYGGDHSGYGKMMLYEIQDTLESLPSAQQWIPCSERLPTTKDDYIITVKDKSLTWTDYVEWSADYHWWEYDDDMVIAWMPLPEPYKGEES